MESRFREPRGVTKNWVFATNQEFEKPGVEVIGSKLACSLQLSEVNPWGSEMTFLGGCHKAREIKMPSIIVRKLFLWD